MEIFQPAEGLPSGSRPARNGGSLLVSEELLARGQRHLPGGHRLAFPEHCRSCPASLPISADCKRWHPFYATQWADARAVLDYVRENYATLRQRTQAFHDALFSSTLPAAVLDAVSANLGILKSPTVLRHEDGNVWAWEGCFCDAGCCPGSCTHVWNYAQAMPHLFPALERTLRERELQNSMDERGHINFRAALPGLPTPHNFHAASDGQLGGIMKVYREWQISGDQSLAGKDVPGDPTQHGFLHPAVGPAPCRAGGRAASQHLRYRILGTGWHVLELLPGRVGGNGRPGTRHRSSRGGRAL